MGSESVSESLVHMGHINLHRSSLGIPSLMGYLDRTMQTRRIKYDCNSPGKESNLLISSFVVGLMEPPIHNNRVIGFGTSNQLFYDHNAESPRAAIYASRNTNLWLIPDLTNRDIVTCQLHRDQECGPDILLVSAYLDILFQPVLPPMFDLITQRCRRNEYQLVIMADTNAHSVLWNCPDTNRRGSKLEEWILTHSLTVLNQGSEFTFYNRRATTIIDVTFASLELEEGILDWQVSDVITESDHRLITFNLRTHVPEMEIKVRRWTVGDWSVFTKSLDGFKPVMPLDGRWTREDVDWHAEALTRDVHTALDRSHPKVRQKVRFPQIKWSDEMTHLKKEVKHAQSHFRMIRTPASHDRLVEARKTLRKAIRRAKRQSWKEFLGSATDSAAIARISRILQNKQNHQLGMLRKEDGIMCSTPEESLTLLVDEHFQGSVEDHEDDESLDPSPDSQEDASIPMRIAAEWRVRTTIKSFGPTKAAGLDEVKPIVLRNFGPRAINRLVCIYKACLTLGYTPKCWRISRVIFIPKPMKMTYDNPRSFRPITLTTFFVKVLERLVLWYLEQEVLSVNPISKVQHAFRRGRSTESALSTMVEYIELALKRRQFALGVFLDIQGAFDNARTESIVQGLRDKRTPESLIRWYQQYLISREILVHHGGVEVKRQLTRGTPQGGVLSPLAWNLTFESFLSLFQDRDEVKVVAYADDAGLVVTGSDPKVLVQLMQTAVNKALAWGDSVGLQFSPPKTEAMLFTRRRKYDDPPSITMRGHEVKYSDEVRYLGVILDSKLLWHAHIKRKIKAAKQHLLRARAAMGKLWGLTPEAARWLYTGIVRPALSYGSVVWVKALRNKTNQDALNKVNRLALLSLGHVRRSTPTAGMEVISNLMPLTLFIQGEAARALIRTEPMRVLPRRSLETRKPGVQGHRQVNQSFLDELDIDIPDGDGRPRCLQWQRQYLLRRTSFEHGKPKPNGNLYTIYTDGSQINGQSGSGMVCFHKGSVIETESFYLGTDTSVFQAEIYAIKKAAEWVKAQNKTFGKVMIHSDSQAALLALDTPWVDSHLVEETIQALNEAGAHLNIQLTWVKAHAGHVGNELADRAAKASTTRIGLPPGDAPRPPTSQLKAVFKEKIHKRWMTSWTARTDCRQTKQWFPEVDSKKAFQIINMDRPQFSRMCQLITGHNYMRRHEGLVNHLEGEQLLCRLCGEEEETSYHIIGECDALATQRLANFGLITQSHRLVWSLSQVSGFIREANLEDLIDGRDIEQ